MRQQPKGSSDIERNLASIMGANNKLVDSLREESETLRRDVRELRHDAALLRALVNELTQQVLKMGGKPSTLQDVEFLQNEALRKISNDTNLMFRTLKDTFNVDEINSLAFTLGIPDGVLGTGTKSDHALRLIEWCKNRDKLLDLSFELQRERPIVSATQTGGR